jgi:pyruvate/2-oxoglutarate dehydrogenase complex dihydrolipoamide dehydrogenase (E3) component
VNGRNLLTHMGKYQGRVCGDVIAARAKGLPDDGPALRDTADDRGAPQAIFTDPQVCMAGLTESKARAEGFTVRAVEYDMGAVPGAALQTDGYTGRAKAVVDEIPLAQLWHAVPAFPTTSEIWLRLLQAYGL